MPGMADCRQVHVGIGRSAVALLGSHVTRRRMWANRSGRSYEYLPTHVKRAVRVRRGFVMCLTDSTAGVARDHRSIAGLTGLSRSSPHRVRHLLTYTSVQYFNAGRPPALGAADADL